MNRSDFLRISGLVLTTLFVKPSLALKELALPIGNFKRVYTDTALKAKFYLFLKNVFNLFPEEKFHSLISKNANNLNSDKDIYLKTQKELSSITPMLSIISYQLPALWKQKTEMAKQSFELLKNKKEYNGYLEIGSSGRYLDYLEEKLSITGNRYYADGKEPGYSLSEIIDRGQLFIGAEYIPFTNYNTMYTEYIAPESLDLVTVYVGFHHCPIELRNKYISSIKDVLRVGGHLILRDHDCVDENQKSIVALAHDVFNMGTNESWDYNSSEIRNFYSLKFIIEFVENLGFTFQNQTLFQDGDPTKNALMLFVKN